MELSRICCSPQTPGGSPIARQDFIPEPDVTFEVKCGLCGGQGSRRPGSQAPPQRLPSEPRAPQARPGIKAPDRDKLGCQVTGWEPPGPPALGRGQFLSHPLCSQGLWGHEGSRTGHPQASGSLSRERTGQRAGSGLSATKWALHSVPQPHPGLAGAHPQPIRGFPERAGVSTRPNSSPDGRDGSTMDGPGGAQTRCFAGWTTGRPALSSAAGMRWTAPQR